MLVIATRPGFYSGVFVPAGAEFDLDLEKLPKGKDGKPVKPSWVEPANAKTRALYSPLPISHPALDEAGRPYPYAVPGAVPGARGASVAAVAEAVNTVNEKANVKADAEAAKVEAAQAKKAEPEAKTLADWAEGR